VISWIGAWINVLNQSDMSSFRTVVSVS